jgi:hypothetical protein
MADGNFQVVFERLRALLKPLEPNMKLKRDDVGVYDIYTNQVRADGYEYAFGAVTIKKSYVSFQLFPVYVYPDLVSDVSEALKKRMQGKTCFNFKTVDDTLLTELEALIAKSAARVERDGCEAPSKGTS